MNEQDHNNEEQDERDLNGKLPNECGYGCPFGGCTACCTCGKH